MFDDTRAQTIAGGYTSSGMWANPIAEIPPARKPSLQALQNGAQVIYAMRMSDGAIKIGCTKDLANRRSSLHGQILGFRPGGFAEEKAIHATLVSARTRGYEYYHPTTAVMAVVNELREEFGLPHIAAQQLPGPPGATLAHRDTRCPTATGTFDVLAD